VGAFFVSVRGRTGRFWEHYLWLDWHRLRWNHEFRWRWGVACPASGQQTLLGWPAHVLDFRHKKLLYFCELWLSKHRKIKHSQARFWCEPFISRAEEFSILPSPEMKNNLSGVSYFSEAFLYCTSAPPQQSLQSTSNPPQSWRQGDSDPRRARHHLRDAEPRPRLCDFHPGPREVSQRPEAFCVCPVEKTRCYPLQLANLFPKMYLYCMSNFVIINFVFTVWTDMCLLTMQLLPLYAPSTLVQNPTQAVKGLVSCKFPVNI